LHTNAAINANIRTRRKSVVDTSIRVKDETYKVIVKTRGAFEQTFGMKMTLDEAIFLATSYINVAYDEFQSLQKDNLLTIDLKWTSLEKVVTKALPRLLAAFENFKKLLNAKEMLKMKAASPHQ
jgi:hypothetical protein